MNSNKLNMLFFEAMVENQNLKIDFFKKSCSKCLGTINMKKRKCGLLFGYKTPCCKLMDDFCEKNNTKHDIIYKCMKEIIKEYIIKKQDGIK
jgi:hypothetical protein